MRLLVYLGLIFFIVAGSSLSTPPAVPFNPRDQTISYIKKETVSFADCIDKLSNAVDKIDRSNPQTLKPVEIALKKCRIQYKRISFFLDYFFPAVGKFYNSPAKREIEEPFIEFEEPRGLQQVEAILYSRHAEKKKFDLQDELVMLSESAHDLYTLYFNFNGDAGQIMESLHIELIRIMTLYISGYDAPDLKTGILESAAAIESFRVVLSLYQANASFADPKILKMIEGTVGYLKTPVDFDHFDRLQFLMDFSLPLEEELGIFIKNNSWAVNTTRHLDYNSKNLFQREIKPFGPGNTKAMISLGEKLFFDQSLSSNNIRSCASCHQPEKYFTDGFVRNRSLDNTRSLSRNTPTLLYAGYQSSQFWDGRAHSLTDQISDVLLNKDEMHASNLQIEKKLRMDSLYQTGFQRAFPEIHSPSDITIEKMKSALAAFIQSLSPMNSAFDKYISGNLSALTGEQKKGFNLFMGKAACGTCHFAPVFNGSLPPFYDRTEYEVLGIPASYQAARKLLDTDLGRYYVYPVYDYSRAFKTPTVRNAEHTQPYMHNGGFRTLDEVLDFYNRGGGEGIGLRVKQQTLPGKPLHLSASEIHAVMAFMNALTDELK